MRHRFASWLSSLGLRGSRLTGSAPGQWSAGLVALSLIVSTAWTARDYFGSYARHPNVPEDFYLPDWELGQYAADQPASATIYLTPTQAEMATIYFALADPERLSSYNGTDGLIPAGRPGTPALYLVRPNHADSLRSLSDYFPEGRLGQGQTSFVPFLLPAGAERVRLENSAEYSWGGQIGLLGWTQAREENQLVVTLAWQAQARPEEDYTAFVHILDEKGELVAQSDHPPVGYPTSDWQPGEIVVDHFRLSLPPDSPAGGYQLVTGWYFLPTLQGLGETFSLGEAVPAE